MDASRQGSSAAFGYHCQGYSVPFGSISQQGATRSYWMTLSQRNCRPFGIPARFEMSTHKWEMVCGHSFQNGKIPQAILQHEEESLWDSLCIEEHGKFARYAPLRRCIDRNTHLCSGARSRDDVSAQVALLLANDHALRHMSSTEYTASQPSSVWAFSASAQKAGRSPSRRGPITYGSFI